MNVVETERPHKIAYTNQPAQVRLYCNRGTYREGSALVRTPWYGPPTIEFYWGRVYYTLVMRSAREAYYVAHHIVRTMAYEGGPHDWQYDRNMFALMRWLRCWKTSWPIVQMMADYPEDTSDEY